jgi:cytochrome c556
MRLSFATATAAALALTATLAFAADAENPAVKARQEAMKAVGGGMKVLGDMAKGATAFDAAAAQAAIEEIHAASMEVPTLFEPQEDDPESEAKAAIWENWDDFVSKAEALQQASMVTVSAEADLGPAMGGLGGTCKACHSLYKE